MWMLLGGVVVGFGCDLDILYGGGLCYAYSDSPRVRAVVFSGCHIFYPMLLVAACSCSDAQGPARPDSLTRIRLSQACKRERY